MDPYIQVAPSPAWTPDQHRALNDALGKIQPSTSVTVTYQVTVPAGEDHITVPINAPSSAYGVTGSKNWNGDWYTGTPTQTRVPLFFSVPAPPGGGRFTLVLHL